MHTLRAQTTKRTDSSKDGLKRVTTNRGKQETEDLTKLSDVKNRYKTEAENINTPCAFHDMERITNFCRNRDCLLPLCPKCVKLHTEEHAKLGVFGEFVTIGECLTQTERGLKTIMLKTLEFQRSLQQLKDQYRDKVALQKSHLKQAKKLFMQQADLVFYQLQRQIETFSNEESNALFEQLHHNENFVQELIDSCKKSAQQMSNGQFKMEGLINYFLSIQGKMEALLEREVKMRQLMPRQVQININDNELLRIGQVIRQYLDIGIKTTATSPSFDQSGQFGNTRVLQSANEVNQMISQLQSSPRYPMDDNTPIDSDIGSFLELSTSIQHFKSPLDNFSLARKLYKKDLVKK